MNDRIESLRAAVRDVPDFPKEGIVFKDITPMLGSAELLEACLAELAARFEGEAIDSVVGIESRGFIFGAALALRLGAGFVPARKPGKLPAATDREEYELEYGTDALELHVDAFGEGARVLIVDDVIATGGTAAAAIELVRRRSAELVGCAFVIELDFLSGRDKLGDTRVESLLHY